MYFGCTPPPIRGVRTLFEVCGCADPKKCCRKIELRCMKIFQKSRESSQIFYTSSRLHRKFSRLFFLHNLGNCCITFLHHRGCIEIFCHPNLRFPAAPLRFTFTRTSMLAKHDHCSMLIPFGKTNKFPQSTFDFHFIATKLTNNICHRAFFVADVVVTEISLVFI